jgi:hypothetical protein
MTHFTPSGQTPFAGDYDQIQLRGFNMVPGVAFITNRGPSDQPRVCVVMKATRDADDEMNHLIARVADQPWNPKVYDYVKGERLGDTFSLSLDYSESIQVIGFVVNPNDKDDDDFGVRPNTDPNGDADLSLDDYMAANQPGYIPEHLAN